MFPCKDSTLAERVLTKYGGDYGGPSDADWIHAWNDGIPHMIIDKDSIYRIYPHPLDSALKDPKKPEKGYKYWPSPNWQSKYKAVPRVFGSCTIL